MGEPGKFQENCKRGGGAKYFTLLRGEMRGVYSLRAKGMLGPFLVEVMLLLPVVEDFVPSMCHESISIQWVKTYKHHWALDPA